MSERKLKARSADINSPDELRNTYVRYAPAVLALCVFAFSSQFLLAGECGPGPHWIGGCDAAAEHIVDTNAALALDTALDETLDGRRDVTINMTGSAIVKQSSGLDHSMQIEIVTMELVGSLRGDTVTVRAGDGAGQVQGHLLLQSVQLPS